LGVIVKLHFHHLLDFVVTWITLLSVVGLMLFHRLPHALIGLDWGTLLSGALLMRNGHLRFYPDPRPRSDDLKQSKL